MNKIDKDELIEELSIKNFRLKLEVEHLENENALLRKKQNSIKKRGSRI